MLRVAGPVLVAVALVGCGGNDGEEFVAKANRACKERATMTHSGGRDRLAEVYEREVAALRKVEPPADKAAHFKKMLALYAERARLQRELAAFDKKIAAADTRTENVDLYVQQTELFDPANRARVQGNKLAGELGLKVCAQRLT